MHLTCVVTIWQTRNVCSPLCHLGPRLRHSNAQLLWSFVTWRTHLCWPLKGAILHKRRASCSVLLALCLGAPLSIAAFLMVSIEVDFDIRGEGVIMRRRGSHVVEGYEMRSKIP